MGSSKKHKDKEREHKHKRHHRSRSRSRSKERRKKEKKHRRRDESVEGSPTRAADSFNRQERSRSPSIQRDREKLDESRMPQAKSGEKPIEETASTSQEDGAGAGLSLSVEETNKLRASLGLKPLNVTDTKKEDGTTDNGDVHVPAVNMAEVKRTEELREKMLQIKEKRRVNKALGKVKKLADDDSDDDSAASWVLKSRKIESDRQKAEQTAKMLEDMDNEFNLGSLVAAEFSEKKKSYDSKDLRGLRVEHAQESFVEGKTTILVLKDKAILEEEDPDDTLVNMNMLDNEHANKNNEAKKKKPDYKPYDEPEFDEYGMMKPKEILDKYDEEIHGKKKESFELGGGGRYNAEHERRMQEIRSALRQQGESLVLPAPKIASEYYTPDEMATFKKPKKKVRTLRKKAVLTADDLLALSSQTEISDHGSRSRRVVESKTDINNDLNDVKVKSESMPDDMDLDEDVNDSSIKTEIKRDIDDDDDDDNIGPSEDLTGFTVDEDASRRDLENVLNKARRLKSAEQRLAPLSEKKIKRETPEDDDIELPFRGQDFDVGPTTSNIVLYSTSEFCRSLGDIPTYGQAGNRDSNDDDIMDIEPDSRAKAGAYDEDDEMGSSAWQSVEIDSKPVEIASDDKPVLDDEPMITTGLAGALLVASKKGYLENKMEKTASASRKAAIEAVNYSIEDKRYDDLDEKYNRKRDRYSTGVTMDFKEKEGYKPDVKLDYCDDQGRTMPPKEAFRQLSHRFHGKGSGKKKTEKRMKKADEEHLMLSMNSTDTPLNTVHMLKERQKTEKTPYVILSGGGKGIASGMLAK